LQNTLKDDRFEKNKRKLRLRLNKRKNLGEKETSRPPGSSDLGEGLEKKKLTYNREASSRKKVKNCRSATAMKVGRRKLDRTQ